MKAIAAAAFFALSRVLVRAEPIDVERQIEAICQVECGTWGKPGGRACINYSLWGDHAPGIAYQLSGNEAYAMPVYRAAIAWICRTLKANGVKVNPQTVGTVWRWGITGARRRGWKSDSGTRTANIYETLPATKK